ncbi:MULTISPECIES: DUF418 domain-containing protein [unclassified Rathayibacter]|uniref:DUF418 domain-containing protein n=1 Tax=unclassified Rathayibacter TaxID=2609250 RepID=UPI0007013646|nr:MULTISPECIES: DUF418 domain-containing protein [unclassified Rathayibacter]KQQ06125.1 hypothetical protein ASF42_06295 [Rathayibacter sp. Leaf294]KQS13982.1 hypothetical protein ASG06_06305 [Rathayibacter sp. Leaf185]
MIETSARPAPRLHPDRLLVPDALRGIAIVAMLVAHAMPLLPSQRTGAIGFVTSNLSDLASPLFALVMGMSAALVLARPGASGGRVVLQNAIRAVILIALGLWLSTWGTWIAIVLAFLGVVLAVGTPILLLRSRLVAAIAVVVVVVGAPLNAAVAAAADPLVRYSQTPAGYALNWVFVGPTYRATSLLPFFLLGALLLRHGFRRDRLLAVLAVVAVLAYPARPLLKRATGLEFVSGSYPDTLHDLGLVLAVYVVVVLIATAKTAQTVFLPFRAVGSLALSVYVLQVGVVAALAAAGYGYTNDTPWAFALLLLGVWAAGVLWWRFCGTGPIEWATGRVTRLLLR